MIISVWFALALAIPVLVLGELLVKRSFLLSRLNIPASVVGGLLVALIILLRNAFGSVALRFETDVDTRWWTWLISAEPEWLANPTDNFTTPFIAVFFACIGLNASWSALRRGGVTTLIFLGLAGLFAVIQNGVGVAMAKALDQPPLLGILCGSISLTGGHVTTIGFATDLEKTGLPHALDISLACATFGIVASGVIGGAVGGMLIRGRHLHSSETPSRHASAMNSASEGWLSDLRGVLVYGRPFLTHVLQSMESGILGDLRALFRSGRPLLINLLLVLVCVKLGSWINFGIAQLNVRFPVLIGAMLAGLLARGIIDASGVKWLREDILDSISSVALGFFIVIAMMTLNLIELRHTAGPILTILVVQVVVMALFAWLVTFRLTGRDYDAAVIAGGHIGFGLGETPNAVANMKALVEVFGPAPRAFIVVVVGSSFILKLVNALNISCFLKLLQF
jgi:ESS family glutamate:Na+ symporter